MTTATPTIGYHFVGDTLRDGRPVPPDGEWLVHDGPVTICITGLHASKHPFDALTYARGATLCLVECEGIVDEHDDKIVCRRRKIVSRIDATDILLEMARWSALQVIHLWDAPDVVRRYLYTGDESLMAASRAASSDTSMAVLWAASSAAAMEAAWYASRDASRSALWSALWAASWAASREESVEASIEALEHAAWAASRSAQKTKFAELVTAKFS